VRRERVRAPSNGGPAEIFTLNRKDCQLQSGLGGGERVDLYSTAADIDRTDKNIYNIVGPL